MTGFKEFLKSWRATPDPDGPLWFDRPDALKLLSRRRKSEGLTDVEFEALRQWAEHGYISLRDLVPAEDIDGMLRDLDGVWSATEPIESLVIEEARAQPEDPPGLAHSRLVGLDQAVREKLKRQYHWRIHGFHRFSEPARRVFQNPAMIRWASLILGRPADPMYTINFTYGSAQDLHQDTAVFYVWPMNALVGAWLACEDIHPDSGPLVYYPGSQRERLFPALSDYPKVNLKNCERHLMGVYGEYLQDVARRYEPRTFVPGRGEIFLWHGMLIHGGAEIRNPDLTRRSYVCHYIPSGCDKSAQAQGPFNW
jgi:phytanoyl-CoA hydroxylase